MLVERVEGFATREEWMRAYSEINEFEEQLVADGIVLVKFWVHITFDEQLRRFKEREKTRYKQWKLTAEDWRNRAKWHDYEQAVNDMVERTSTRHRAMDAGRGQRQELRATESAAHSVRLAECSGVTGATSEPLPSRPDYAITRPRTPATIDASAAARVAEARKLHAVQQLGLQRGRRDLRTAHGARDRRRAAGAACHPLRFEDWDRTAQHKEGDMTVSKYPAYPIWISTRDMARIGYLMLHEGQWNGRQVISKDWARRIISVVTPVQEMNPVRRRDGYFGYGYMWWIWDGPRAVGPFKGAYSAVGAVGQFRRVTAEPARRARSAALATLAKRTDIRPCGPHPARGRLVPGRLEQRVKPHHAAARRCRTRITSRSMSISPTSNPSLAIITTVSRLRRRSPKRSHELLETHANAGATAPGVSQALESASLARGGPAHVGGDTLEARSRT